MMPDKTSCKHCGQPVVWRTYRRKRVPCDPPTVTIVSEFGEVTRGHTVHPVTCKRASWNRGAES